MKMFEGEIAYEGYKLDGAEKVRLAVLWLDEHHKGWHRKINLATLCLPDPRRCIGGQMGMDWRDLRDGLAETYGGCDVLRGVLCAPTYEPFWREEILNRRFADDIATTRPKPRLVEKLKAVVAR